MSTPAEELRAAATKLRNTAQRAHFEGERWFVDVAGPIASTAWLGPSHDVLTATWLQAAWVALMHPKLAEPLAAWLEALATGWQQSIALYPDGAATRFGDHPALAVARAINGGAS